MRIESHEIAGPAGRLEALLTVAAPAAADVQTVAVVCHPHPLFGGTLHNKVVFHVSRALAGLGWPVLRFNYRGVGSSAGSLDRQAGAGALIEAAGQDLGAALEWLVARYPSAAVCGAGFSFGARTVLTVARAEPRLTRLLAVGTPAGPAGNPPGSPAAMPDFASVFSLVAELRQPKLFIQGSADEYGPAEFIEQVFAAAAGPKRLIVVPNAGHFFDGHLEELRRAASEIAGV